MKSFYSEADLSLEAFDQICQQSTSQEDYPHAIAVEKNVVLYGGDALRDASDTLALKAEFAGCLKDGPGVFAIRGACPDISVIDRSTELLN